MGLQSSTSLAVQMYYFHLQSQKNLKIFSFLNKNNWMGFSAEVVVLVGSFGFLPNQISSCRQVHGLQNQFFEMHNKSFSKMRSSFCEDTSLI